MVVVGQAISPLSEKITAITWDGVALESAPLKVIGLPDRGVRLEWTAPSKLPGKLEQYRIEHYVEVDTDVESTQVPFMVTSRTFSDLTPNATYNFRVIPKTRGGYPTDLALAVRKQFPWVQYTVPAGDDSNAVDSADTAAPILRVDNINETAWLVVWQTERTASKFVVAYRSLADGGDKRRLVVDGRDRSVVLTDGLVKGVTYEISVFAVNAEGERGLAATQLLRVPLSRPPTTRGPATDVPPKPVMCEPPCTCEPVGGGVMRLGWIRPNGGSSKITHYLARYTLDENDGTKEWQTFRT
uniref:Fibronectin type-III domain-containing protein n=1 Tax=Plectus sambesii TaxID=2011161 RepID=A0A914UWC2_9BILA